MASVQWWLTDGEGTRIRVDAGGVHVGRSPSCDLVLRDARASRSQAIVYLDGERPRLLLLGKGKTEHNGVRVAREAHLEVGDTVEFPGATITVATSHEREPSEGGWVLERPGGGFFGVPGGPFVIGGHERDDLQLTDWPDHALTLQPTQRRLHLTAGVDLAVDDESVPRGALVPLSPGSRIRYGAETLRVVTGHEVWHGSTVASLGGGESELPRRVRLEFLPRGGRLRVHTGESERSVFLPGQRSELMALLLKPPTPYALGQTLDDDVLITRLWPKQERTRVDLNTLIYRLRKDLVRAGIDPSGFVVRAPGGGGTRVGLSAGAAVEVG